MKKVLSFVAMVAIVVGIGCWQVGYAAQYYSSKSIEEIIIATGDNCFYFKLIGVSVADSVANASSPLFAVSRTDSAAKDILAALMSAKALGNVIDVDTNGQAICGGFARANGVYIK